jgi:hypothetical protein
MESKESRVMDNESRSKLENIPRVSNPGLTCLMRGRHFNFAGDSCAAVARISYRLWASSCYVLDIAQEPVKAEPA